MALVCPNCKTSFIDLGGNPASFQCNVCGYTPLVRTPAPMDNDTAVGMMAGAAIGAAFGSWPGAIVGGILGALIGAQKNRPPKCQ